METAIVTGVTIFATVVVVALIFRQQFGGFIDRAHKFGFGGAQIEAPGGQPPSATPATITANSANTIAQASSDPRRAPDPDPIYADLEKEAREVVNKAGASDDAARLAWAYRLAAVIALQRNFETTYRGIFGSQIQLLKDLNPYIVLNRSHARTLYARGAKDFPEYYKGYTFDNWLDWLVNNKLIEPNSSDPKSKLQLTDVGRAFLLHMTRFGLSDAKAG